jgi:uncharacterized protein DUF6711
VGILALLTIGGQVMPTPTDLNVGVMDLSKAERNSNGAMIIERIATKKKLAITYSYLSADDLSTVLKAISGTFYDVQYLDPVTNSFKTSSFYCGDRSIGMVSFVDSVPKYKEVTFDLIER